MQDRRFRNLENVERVKILSARRATDLDPDFDEFLLCLSPFSLVAPSLDGKHSWKKTRPSIQLEIIVPAR